MTHQEDCPDIYPPACLNPSGYGLAAPPPPQLHHTVLWLWDIRVLAEYGLAPHLALQALLPIGIVQTRTTYTDLDGNPISLSYPSIHHQNETLTGLRDAQLLLHHAWDLGGAAISERVGISIPFGTVHPDPFALGDEGLVHEHIQFGTGTLDPVVGLDASKDFGGWSLAAFFFAQMPLYSVGIARGDGTDVVDQYQAGTRISGGVAASSSLGLIGPSFRLTALVAQEFPERWNGATPVDEGNRGRTDLFVGPGMTLPFLDDWSVSLEVRVRVWGQLVGAQMSLPVVVDLSVGRLFHLERTRSEPEPIASAKRGDVEDIVAAGEAAPLTPVPGKWTVFDFWAPWCEACKGLDAELRKLAEDNPSIAIRRVNIVDFDSAIARQELPGVAMLPHVRLVAPNGTKMYEESGTPERVLTGIRAAIAK